MSCERLRLQGGPRIIQGAFADGSARVARPSGSEPLVVQRSATGVRVTPLPADVVYELGRSSAPRFLPRTLQAQLENALGHDFARTRIHVGGDATLLGARAFTMGEDVFIGPGCFEPFAPEGVRLIARQLAHVVQQRQGRVTVPGHGGVYIVADARLEAEAEYAAARALATTALHSSRGRPASQARPFPFPSPPVLQRMEAQNKQEVKICELFSGRLGVDAKAAGAGTANADVALSNGLNVWISEAKGTNNHWLSADNISKSKNTPCKQLFGKLHSMRDNGLVCFSPHKQATTVEQYIVGDIGRKTGYAALLLGCTGLDWGDCLILATVGADGKLKNKRETYFPTTLTALCRILERPKVDGFDNIRDYCRENPSLLIELEESLGELARKNPVTTQHMKLELQDDEKLRLLPVIDIAPFINNPARLYRVEPPAYASEESKKPRRRAARPHSGEKEDPEIEGLLEKIERGRLVFWKGDFYEADDGIEDAIDVRTAWLTGSLEKGDLEQAVATWELL